MMALASPMLLAAEDRQMRSISFGFSLNPRLSVAIQPTGFQPVVVFTAPRLPPDRPRAPHPNRACRLLVGPARKGGRPMSALPFQSSLRTLAPAALPSRSSPTSWRPIATKRHTSAAAGCAWRTWSSPRPRCGPARRRASGRAAGRPCLEACRGERMLGDAVGRESGEVERGPLGIVGDHAHVSGEQGMVLGEGREPLA